MPLTTHPTSVFPLYLLPSIPFRRRSSTSTATPPPSSSPEPPTYLNGAKSLLRCSRCLAHLCPTTSIISKGFTGRHGRAYLVAPPTSSLGTITPPNEPVLRHHEAGNLPNTHVHKPTPRMLVTGAHTVSDISCVPCGAVLGWKYVDAEEESQKYKVGMYILETRRVVRGVDWEGGANEASTLSAPLSQIGTSKIKERKDSGVSMCEDGKEDIEFDSQDEDECEEMFMGIWTPATARTRRKAKVWRDESDIV